MPTRGGALELVVSAAADGQTDLQVVPGTAVQTYPISPGGAPVTVASAAGEDIRLTFDGTAGQRVSLGLSDVTIGTSTCCSTKVSILRPNGSTLAYATYVGTKGGFLDARALPSDGTYTILVDPQSAEAGSITLTLHDVPPDAEGSGVMGGAPASLATTVPGQNALLVSPALPGAA